MSLSNQVEEQLRESEERFRATFEQVAVGMAHVGTDGSWLRINQRLCDIVGYERAELLEMTFQDITYPDDLETDLAYVAALLAAEISSFTMEKRYIRKDGSLVWANLTASLVRDSDGKPLYFISVVEDITDRKKQQETLHRSEERFRAVFDNAGVGIAVFDEDLRPAMTNPALQEMLGYTAGELAALTVEALTHPDDYAADDALFTELLADKRTSYQMEKRYIHKDGHIVWGRLTVTIVRDRNGAPQFVVGMVNNISEKRSAEQAMRASETRFRAIVEQSPVSIQVLAPDGKTIMVNRAWEDLWGLTLAQLQDYNTLQDPQLVETGIMPYIQRAFSGEATAIPAIKYDLSVTIPGVEPDAGSVRWVEAFIYPVTDEAGDLLQVILVHQDVSERERAGEELRKHAREITELNERLQRAMLETHHRVRNNLQMIAAFVDLQIQDSSDIVPVSELSRIGGQVRALAAVHDILTNQAAVSDANHLSAGEVLEKLVSLLQQTNPARSLSLSIEQDLQLPLRQGTSLVIVANEAITNALKYSQGAIEVTFKVSDTIAALDVGDDGPGFSSTFDPESEQGYGIALISNITQWDLGGKSTFTNRAGGGGVVSMTFPASTMVGVKG